MEQEYHQLFPGEVEAVHPIYDTAALDKVAHEYDVTRDKLTDLLDEYTSRKRRHAKIKRKTVRPSAHPWPILVMALSLCKNNCLLA